MRSRKLSILLPVAAALLFAPACEDPVDDWTCFPNGADEVDGYGTSALCPNGGGSATPSEYGPVVYTGPTANIEVFLDSRGQSESLAIVTLAPRGDFKSLHLFYEPDSGSSDWAAYRVDEEATAALDCPSDSICTAFNTAELNIGRKHRVSARTGTEVSSESSQRFAEAVSDALGLVSGSAALVAESAAATTAMVDVYEYSLLDINWGQVFGSGASVWHASAVSSIISNLPNEVYLGYGDNREHLPNKPSIASVQSGTDEDRTDADEDGYSEYMGDCDDHDWTAGPYNRLEGNDGVDNDCDGFVDEEGDSTPIPTPTPSQTPTPTDAFTPTPTIPEVTETLNPTPTSSLPPTPTQPTDADEDGYPFAEDCDDSDPNINPGKQEKCDPENLDEDCDGLADDADDSATGQTWWYEDDDGDGYGDEEIAPVERCDPEEGEVATRGDCDDSDASFYPGAPEVCTDEQDFNCDGSVGYTDADSDGFAACEECDDENPNINPSAQEVCDEHNVDEDCDGLADDADPSAQGQITWYSDSDGDGYGNEYGNPVTQCEQPPNHADVAGDCEDGKPLVNPEATELCNEAGVDEDCDGLTDEGFDADGDGTADCTDDDGDGWSEDDGDCDDEDGESYPGAPEVCGDSVDQNCNGVYEVCSTPTPTPVPTPEPTPTRTIPPTPTVAPTPPPTQNPTPTAAPTPTMASTPEPTPTPTTVPTPPPTPTPVPQDRVLADYSYNSGIPQECAGYGSNVVWSASQGAVQASGKSIGILECPLQDTFTGGTWEASGTIKFSDTQSPAAGLVFAEQANSNLVFATWAAWGNNKLTLVSCSVPAYGCSDLMAGANVDVPLVPATGVEYQVRVRVELGNVKVWLGPIGGPEYLVIERSVSLAGPAAGFEAYLGEAAGTRAGLLFDDYYLVELAQ